MFYINEFLNEVYKRKPNITKDHQDLISKTLDYILIAEEGGDFDITAMSITRVLGTDVDPLNYSIRTEYLERMDTQVELSKYLINHLTSYSNCGCPCFDIVEVIHVLSEVLEMFDAEEESVFIVGSGTSAVDRKLECVTDLVLLDIDPNKLYIEISWDSDDNEFMVKRIYKEG